MARVQQHQLQCAHHDFGCELQGADGGLEQLVQLTAGWGCRAQQQQEGSLQEATARPCDTSDMTRVALSALAQASEQPCSQGHMCKSKRACGLPFVYKQQAHLLTCVCRLPSEQSPSAVQGKHC